MGEYVKVSAIDPKTGREVSIAGDARTSKKDLEILAIRKLHYVLKKKRRKTKKDKKDKNLYC